MLTPESIKRLQERLLEKGSDIAQRMAEFINVEFPEFAALTHVPMSDLGINKEGEISLVVKEKSLIGKNGAADIAVAIVMIEELNTEKLKSAYDLLSKLKNELEIRELQTIIVAKSSNKKIITLGETVTELNCNYHSATWLDNVVVLNEGMLSYGVHDPCTKVIGHWLFHTATLSDMTIPALYYLLLVTAIENPLVPLFWRIATNLLVVRPSKRHKEVHELLTDEGRNVLTMTGYQCDLQGKLKPVPEDQYRGRMLPNFPLKIVTQDGKELGQVEYLKWQNGGVIIVTGEFPLDVFFGFRKFRISRPVSTQRKEKYQISSVLPLSKLGFQNLLAEIQGKSNIKFQSSRPPMVIQKISNEGVSTPIIARLRMGLMTFRDKLPPEAIDISAYDKALDLTLTNLMNARTGLNLIRQLFADYEEDIREGKIVRVQGNMINISEPIDDALGHAVESFINNCGRAFKTGMQRLVATLGGDIGFLFQKDSAFETGLAKLFQSDPRLAAYLKSCRQSWTEILSDLRNSLEHDDRILQRVGHDLKGSNVVVLEPELKGRPVRELLDFIFDRLSKFVEEVTVHSLQRKMMYGFIFEEIPLSDRDPKSASRFEPGISRDNIGWDIEYSNNRFDES